MYKFNEPGQAFGWDVLGNVSDGRKSLGEDMSVYMYRLFQYSLKKILTDEMGNEKAREVFRKAGLTAGISFAEHFLDKSLPFNNYAVQMQQVFKREKIGILQVDKYSPDTLSMIINVYEDLDCSGLPASGESVCDYDEGFIAGILFSYSGKRFNVREIECWASGGRMCRFSIHPEDICGQ